MRVFAAFVGKDDDHSLIGITTSLAGAKKMIDEANQRSLDHGMPEKEPYDVEEWILDGAFVRHWSEAAIQEELAKGSG